MTSGVAGFRARLAPLEDPATKLTAAAGGPPPGFSLAASRHSPFSGIVPPSGGATRMTTPSADPPPCSKIYDLTRPPIGSRNTQGRRPRMEDTDKVVHNLVEDVPVLLFDGGRIVPKTVENGLAGLFDDEDAVAGGSLSPRTPLARFASDDSEEGLRASVPLCYGGGNGRRSRMVRSNFHFAGVFDGHGGQAVSRRVAESLHSHVRDALREAALRPFSSSFAATSSSSSSSMSSSMSSSSLWEVAATALSEDVTMDEAAPTTMASGVFGRALKRKHSPASDALRDSSNSMSVCSFGSSFVQQQQQQQQQQRFEVTTMDGSRCTAKPPLAKTARKGANLAGGPPQQPPLQVLSRVTIERIAEGLTTAFKQMDEELKNDEECKHVGSTAVVSLVSRENIFVANCGDSRAVLSRAGTPYRLSRDHKPELDDEQERIEKYGGKVLDFNGKRVMGLLAMTRAFGDHFLRDVGVIAEPEITAIDRTAEDEFLILGSDGLWDVLGDREACDLTQRCFQRAEERRAGPETASRVAASVLMRAALDRGSGDNITVVVVDLRPEMQMS